MPGEGDYARVYYSIRSDPKFEGIASDPLAMGHYLLLLLAAETSFPDPTPVPRWVDEAVLTDLIGRGIIDAHPADCYSVHGLEAERRQRRAGSRKGGLARSRKGKRNEQGRFDPEPSK